MSTTADDGIDSDPTVPATASADADASAASSDLSDPHLGAVPRSPATDLPPEAPEIAPALDPVPGVPDEPASAPLVEPLETFVPRLERVARIPGPAPAELAASRAPLPRSVSHLQFQTPFKTSQGSRGSCWAFAGIAALEAAYARINVPRRPVGAVPVPPLQGARESPQRRWHQFADRLSRQLPTSSIT